jgi:glutamine amidotransferase
MCRHLAWLGAPRSVAELVLAPEFGLLRQSYAPRRQQFGTINADGWGVGLLQDGSVHRWRASTPLWSHASFASIAPLLRSGCVVAAVRSATVGMPIEEAATAPFTDGRWLLSHNGRIERSVLPTGLDAESLCDSALLAAHVFATGPEALADTVPALGRKDPGARLNLLLTDGRQIVATRWGDTLAYRIFDDGVVVASEAWDDNPAWVDIPDRHLLEIRPGPSPSVHPDVTLTPLLPQ